MRLFNRPTPDAIEAANYYNHLTGSYAARAVGRRVVIRLSIAQARHEADLVAADQHEPRAS